MAQSAFSLLLLRRISCSSIRTFSTPHDIRSLIVGTSLFSTSASLNQQSSSTETSKPSSLSARMSFVFDQIDAIEKQQSQQDQTLQRIRAWRQSKQPQQRETPEAGIESCASEDSSSDLNEPISAESNSGQSVKEKGVVEFVHPWPEWIELMERFVQQNYFDHRRKDEDNMIEGLGINVSDVLGGGGDDVGVDLFRDFKTVRTACLNFGRDRFDIMRSLSRQDIQILVGYGCPSPDKKVAFSGKLLRKLVHLDEGDVCSSCSLRSTCEKAYLLTNKEDEARTIDVMRVLLIYAFESLDGSVVNKSLLKQKSVKTVVRKLLHEIVKLSAVPIDPNLPPPVIKRPPPKVKQAPPPPRKRVGRDDVEMKKGDWLCPKCDFLNFAKNTICLQCDAKRPKRQLLPGEWECPECNFLNYRRNMACFHCDCKRPHEEMMETKTPDRQHTHRTGFEKVPNRMDVSNAWNFDFDDDESDGADVAAFEYADSPVTNEKPPLISRANDGNFRGYGNDFSRDGGAQGIHKRNYSEPERDRPQTGFDDFDDEDDIDSYEIDTQNKPVQRASYNDFSEVEGLSESENVEASNDNFYAHGRTHNRHQKTKISGSENDELDYDSDENMSGHRHQKSSHVADSRHRNKGNGRRDPSRGFSFGSDEELDSDLDADFNKRFRSTQGKSKASFKRRSFSDTEENSFSGSESDGGDDLPSWRTKSGRNKGQSFNGRGDSNNFGRGAQFLRSDVKMNNRRNSWNDDFDNSSPRGSRSARFQDDNEFDSRRTNDRKGGGGGIRNSKGPKREGFGNQRHQASYGDNDDKDFGRRQDNEYGRRKTNDKRGGLKSFKGGPKREDGFRNRQRGMSYEHDKDRDSGNFRNSRRVIER